MKLGYLVFILCAVISHESAYAMRFRRPIRMILPPEHIFQRVPVQAFHDKTVKKSKCNKGAVVGDAISGAMGGMLGIGTGAAWGAVGGCLVSLPVGVIGLLAAPNIDTVHIIGGLASTGAVIGGVINGFTEADEWGGKAGVVGLGTFLGGTAVVLGALGQVSDDKQDTSD